MDAYLSESTQSIRSSVAAFTDEIEGELEKVQMPIFGVHITRKVTLLLLGLLAIFAVGIGVVAGILGSSSSSIDNDGVDHSAFRLEHRYWSIGESIESTVGAELFDNSTHEYEALVWLADTDPLQLDVTSPLEVVLQRYIVANFYFATNGAAWTDQFNFLSAHDVCDWNDETSGIFCNKDGKVTDILLQKFNLEGTIPHDIGLLSHMKVINVTGNELEGDIPVSLGIMSALKSIDLSENRFASEIPPSVAMLLDLEVLNLSFNSLVGGDGARALKDLPSLEEVNLSHNLLGGNIGQLGKSESLRRVDLSSNLIQGTIPSSFGEGKNLEYLNLNDNELSGVIPKAIGNLQSLVELDISDNNLSGSLSGSLPEKLQILKLNSNNLQYDLPTELGTLDDLSMLQLSNNGFDKIPTELFNLKNLQVLSLSYNSLSGSIPKEIGLASSLVLLDLSHNKLSHELPSEIARLETLEYLFLSSNNFKGTIPSVFSNLYLLKTMDVSSNHFSGDMDAPFCSDRPEWGNQINGYRADCLNDDLSLSCATVCCDGKSYCCDMPDETDCKLRD